MIINLRIRIEHQLCNVLLLQTHLGLMVQLWDKSLWGIETTYRLKRLCFPCAGDQGLQLRWFIASMYNSHAITLCFGYVLQFKFTNWLSCQTSSWMIQVWTDLVFLDPFALLVRVLLGYAACVHSERTAPGALVISILRIRLVLRLVVQSVLTGKLKSISFFLFKFFRQTLINYLDWNWRFLLWSDPLAFQIEVCQVRCFLVCMSR